MGRLSGEGVNQRALGSAGTRTLASEADWTFLGQHREGFFVPWAIVLAQVAVGAVATVVVLWRTKGRAASR
jgi:hypothetical protein